MVHRPKSKFDSKLPTASVGSYSVGFAFCGRFVRLSTRLPWFAGMTRKCCLAQGAIVGEFWFSSASGSCFCLWHDGERAGPGGQPETEEILMATLEASTWQDSTTTGTHTSIWRKNRLRFMNQVAGYSMLMGSLVQ